MSTTTQTNPTHILYQGKWYMRNSMGNFYGWVQDLTKELPYMVDKLPPIIWTGAKIPWDLWTKVIAFMVYSYEKTRSESQARWFYHPTENKWDAWVFPQKAGTGMTTQEIEDHPKRAAERAQFPSPWTCFGSIHHHCSAGAFQSGTDHDNERTQIGVHITVGKLGEAKYEYHTRVNCGQTQYEGNILDWVELPPEYYNVPEDVRFMVLNTVIARAIKSDAAEIPQAWKDNLIESNHGFFGGAHTGSGNGVGGASGYNPPHYIPTRHFTQVKPPLNTMRQEVQIVFGLIYELLMSTPEAHLTEEEIVRSFRPPTNKEDEKFWKEWGIDEELTRHRLIAKDLNDWLTHYSLDEIGSFVMTGQITYANKQIGC